MTGASPVTTIYDQRPSQRRIVVAPLAWQESLGALSHARRSALGAKKELHSYKIPA